MSAHQDGEGWFYVDGDRTKQGPYSVAEFKDLADRGVIRGETIVWSQGYPEWLPAREIEGLMEAGGKPPPLPAGAGEVQEFPREQVEPSVVAEPNAPEPEPEPLPDEDLKPRRGSFMFPRIMIGLGVSLVASGATAVGLLAGGLSPVFAALVFLILAALVVYAAFVAYRKERYELKESTVLWHRGGMVSDQTTELEIRNITHVKVKLPWLRYKLFGVGNVVIESAGNAQPVVLRAIYRPEEIYAQMGERLKSNGYDLTRRELLHEESPATIGVVTECLGMAGAAGVAVLFGFGTIAASYEAAAEMGLSGLVLVLGAFFILCAPLFLVVHFLDMRRRTYRVFNDVVVYEEGFLTRENAFIPYENISDASTKRSFLDQLLNLFDVVISCQGSSSEIKFRRLQHGARLSECIDRLVLEAGRKPKLKKPSRRTTGDSAPAVARRQEPELIPPGEAWIADLRMHSARTLVPLMFWLPLVPVWVLAMIQAAIKLYSTRYAVRPGSIRHSYRFLTTNDREFAYDKITGLIIKENLWDRMFGTVTLKFWSIGSGQSLELAHVLRSQVDLEALKRQLGIPPASADPCEIPAAFGPITWLRANLYPLVLLLALAIAPVWAAIYFGENIFYYFVLLPAVIALPWLVFGWLYYPRQRLQLHDHHLAVKQGIIARREYFARYRNVKKNHLTRYPGGSEGSLQIFVAGEEAVQSQEKKGGKKQMAVPCSIKLGFLPAVGEKAHRLDDILCGLVDPAAGAVPTEPGEPLFETSRGVGNSVLVLVLWSVVLVPLIVLLPVTLPMVVVVMKKWRYRIDPHRVVASWGVLYQKQDTIILDRVDSLQQHQGPLNKMFGNGNVSIMTAGSSKPDLVMRAARDFQKLYQEIRDRSRA